MCRHLTGTDATPPADSRESQPDHAAAVRRDGWHHVRRPDNDPRGENRLLAGGLVEPRGMGHQSGAAPTTRPTSPNASCQATRPDRSRA